MSENQQKTMVQEAPLTDDMFERIGTEGLSGEDIGKQSLDFKTGTPYRVPVSILILRLR